MLSAENEQLNAELQAKVEELRASRARIVEAGYAERRRVERDLHDGAQQRLMALTMNLRLARDKLDEDPAATGELLDEAMDELAAATAELRELARGIHPVVLTDRGLRRGARRPRRTLAGPGRDRRDAGRAPARAGRDRPPTSSSPRR